MSHTINYEGLEGDAKRNKAMEDVKFWLGEHFEKAHAAAIAAYKAKPYSLETFRMSASFAGVQGYPVEAWFESIEAECKVVVINPGDIPPIGHGSVLKDVPDDAVLKKVHRDK